MVVAGIDFWDSFYVGTVHDANMSDSLTATMMARFSLLCVGEYTLRSFFDDPSSTHHPFETDIHGCGGA